MVIAIKQFFVLISPFFQFFPYWNQLSGYVSELVIHSWWYLCMYCSFNKCLFFQLSQL